MATAGLAGRTIRPMRYRLGPIFWGVVLIVLGALFLAQELGNGAFDVGEFIGRWWPLLLVLLGLWFIVQAAIEGSAPGWGWSGWRTGMSVAGVGERVSLDLEGAGSAEMSIGFGAGELFVARGPAGRLVEGTFGGGVRPEAYGPGRVRLSAVMPFSGWGPGRWSRTWRVGVTGEVPLALTVETGASRNDLDLTDLRLTDLSVRTGASDTIVRLPSSAGSTRARIDAGAASIRVFAPPNVALRILGRVQVGTNDVDTRRFPPTGTGWSSPDFEGADNRVELVITGGLATLQVA